MTITRTVARAAALPAALMLALAACGGDPDPIRQEETVYAPQAFGEDGKCYFVDDPEEVAVLVDDDLCEPQWAAYPAPMPWLFLYAPYYSSPAYVDRYVPERRRTDFRRAASTFQRKNAAEIDKAAPLAKYKGSDGQTYTGKQVATNPGGFGNGAKGFGKGAPKACAMSGTSPVDLGNVATVAHSVVLAQPGDGAALAATAPRPPAPRPQAPRPAAPRTQTGGGNKAPAGSVPGGDKAPRRATNPRC